MFRVQTVNHALSGRLVVFKRDNTHELNQTPKPKLTTTWVVVDADTLESTVFTDPLSLAKHMRETEQRILADEAKHKEDSYEAALARYTDNFQDDIG